VSVENHLQRNWIFPQLPLYGFLILIAFSFRDPVLQHLPHPAVFIPFFASAILFGLPHGAVDDQVWAGFLKKPSALWAKILLIDTSYILIALAYLSFWLFYPNLAFALFIIITWFHWGQGDLYAVHRFYKGHYLDSPLLKVLIILIRGGLPMLLTGLCFPQVYLSVAEWTVTAIKPGASFVTFDSNIFQFFPILYLAFTSLIIVYFLLLLIIAPRNNKFPALLDAAEVLILFLLFSSIHPLLSIGFYFCFWHSTRHLTRLSFWFNPPGGPTHKFYWFPRRILLRSAPNTAFALLGSIGIFSLLGFELFSLEQILGLYLVLIAILTLPHIVVVSKMDLVESSRP
jgi:Brp/Blh family beta-carotene 15,15'-monooxygenase